LRKVRRHADFFSLINSYFGIPGAKCTGRLSTYGPPRDRPPAPFALISSTPHPTRSRALGCRKTSYYILNTSRRYSEQYIPHTMPFTPRRAPSLGSKQNMSPPAPPLCCVRLQPTTQPSRPFVCISSPSTPFYASFCLSTHPSKFSRVFTRFPLFLRVSSRFFAPLRVFSRFFCSFHPF
jgi:hypothetical protein